MLNVAAVRTVKDEKRTHTHTHKQTHPHFTDFFIAKAGGISRLWLCSWQVFVEGPLSGYA